MIDINPCGLNEVPSSRSILPGKLLVFVSLTPVILVVVLGCLWRKGHLVTRSHKRANSFRRIHVAY